jgi:hypothetical protein
MHEYRINIASAVLFGLSSFCHAKDDAGKIKKIVERSTLNQPGTKPFHLKAVIAPSRESDRGPNRTGEVEIWWASRTQWRREVRSPEFHQILRLDEHGHGWERRKRHGRNRGRDGQNGPSLQEGVMTTSIAVDRAGRVREIGTIVTDNNAMSEAARKVIAAMQFAPYLEDGVPVQVVSRITIPFKATRPQGEAPRSIP